MLIAEIVGPYVRGRVRQGEIVPRTARNYYGTLAGFAASADCDASKLSERHVRRWLEEHEHLAASTRRNRLATVRTFCHWLHDEGLCPRDACRKIKGLREPKRVPRALTHEQVDAVLDACPDTRARVAVVLMVQLGLRRGEVASLEIGDFDLTNRMLVVTGKGGHQRALFVTEQAYQSIIEHLSVQEVPSADGRHPSGRYERAHLRSVRMRWCSLLSPDATSYPARRDGGGTSQ